MVLLAGMSELDRHTRSAFRKELQRAEEERARLEVVIAYLRERLDEASPNSTHSAPKPPLLTEVDETTGHRRAVRVTVANASHHVLTERGTPMRARDLVQPVRELGASAQDAETLSRALKRDRRFSKEGRGLWGLIAWKKSQAVGQESTLGELGNGAQ